MRATYAEKYFGPNSRWQQPNNQIHIFLRHRTGMMGALSSRRLCALFLYLWQVYSCKYILSYSSAKLISSPPNMDVHVRQQHAYCTYAPRHLSKKCLFICFFCWCATKENKDTSVKRQTQWSRCCCWKSFARMSRWSTVTLLLSWTNAWTMSHL